MSLNYACSLLDVLRLLNNSDQLQCPKMPESERIPVLIFPLLHKALSLALISCNGCATLGIGPKAKKVSSVLT